MVSAANHDGYGNSAWGSGPTGNSAWGNQPSGNQPWGSGGWGDRPHWARGLPKPVWIGLMVLGFIFWWPVGLAMLFFLMASGQLRCGSRQWSNQPGSYAQGQGSGPWGGWGWGRWCGGDRTSPNATQAGSGNRAFDDYRAETLRRLEEEQREFAAFLERLRVAKDKAEFDQFMTERRHRPPQAPDAPEPPQA